MTKASEILVAMKRTEPALAHIEFDGLKSTEGGSQCLISQSAQYRRLILGTTTSVTRRFMEYALRLERASAPAGAGVALLVFLACGVVVVGTMYLAGWRWQ